MYLINKYGCKGLISSFAEQILLHCIYKYSENYSQNGEIFLFFLKLGGFWDFYYIRCQFQPYDGRYLRKGQMIGRCMLLLETYDY